jgi:hypothetical protein
MKRILTVCLLGILSLTQVTAGSLTAKAAQKTVACEMMEWSLLADSDTEDGRIVLVQIFNSANQLVLEEEYYSYSVSVPIDEFKDGGNFTAKVFTQYSQPLIYPFSL